MSIYLNLVQAKLELQRLIELEQQLQNSTLATDKIKLVRIQAKINILKRTLNV